MSTHHDRRSVKEQELTQYATSEGSSVPELEAGSASPQQLNRIYWKLDLRIIPALWGLYFLTSLGSAIYGNTLTMNLAVGHSMPAYLGLSKHALKTASALYYVGYIVFDLPMNLIMSVVAPHAWMARIVITVGVVYSCYSVVKNDSGIMAVRFISGLMAAGVWPGMAYYICLWYPSHRTAQRIGYYFTAAQLSAAAAGLIAGGVQRMDMVRGYTGYQWLYIIYGVVTTAYGLTLMFWLPDRPEVLRKPVTSKIGKAFDKLIPHGSSPLKGEDARIHAQDMQDTYNKSTFWNVKDLWKVLCDPRLWPLVIMYFGVVGTGIALMVFATTIIKQINPGLSSINLSLLTAPIWLFDLGSILIFTPLSDRLKNHRGLVFSCSTLVIICGLFVTTYAKPEWSRYGGLLICGAGLGPTVPITMSWGTTIFAERHGDLGAAASAALISGLGNLGSVTTTYALYSGWPADIPRGYRDSNMVMVAILGISILGALCCTLLRFALGDFKGQSLVDVTFLRWFRRR